MRAWKLGEHPATKYPLQAAPPRPAHALDAEGASIFVGDTVLYLLTKKLTVVQTIGAPPGDGGLDYSILCQDDDGKRYWARALNCVLRESDGSPRAARMPDPEDMSMFEIE